MDDNQFLGQGINALIPKKNKNPQNNGQDLLEDRINGKISDTFSNLSSDLIKNSFSGSGGQPDKEKENLELGNLNSLKENFQDDFTQNKAVLGRTEMMMEFSNLSDVSSGNFLPKKEIQKTPFFGHLGHQGEERIFYIEIDKIKPNPQQPRKIFSEESLRELADSIKEYGILEPLLVTRIEKETEKGTEVEYQLISGERRLMASKLLGLPSVPVIIKKPIAEQRKLEMALIENIQREDLSSVSKAKAFARLISEFGLTQQELAERLGKSREAVANILRLLQLPYEAQMALEENKINEGHARAILLFNNPEKRRAFLKEILAKNLSGREAFDLARHYLGSEGKKDVSPRRKNVSLNPEDLEWREKLEGFLQTPVLIKKRGSQGAIEIRFFSEEELEKILKRILEDKVNPKD
ncbi:MAG: ParB/RepB/Spo0J family partition protein [Candidatus Paceibacterota bacterium]|jgi:ParB family chromosome partitioning protein|nr:ParB/RepB/Spo0J family partition protein [Candidatus Paceibacterota bacterium]MDD5545482.1 ParB/RepB/Spo0J family partition protein [Candidatus Paceibacterota bacterium]